MSERIRRFVQTMKAKLFLPNLSVSGREKVDLLTKFSTDKVNEIAEKLKQDALKSKVRELVTKYEKFTGVEEIMALQHTVVEAQERFVAAQEKRREYGRQVAAIEARLKELHAEMQNTMKGDEKYLHLCTEEHKLIIQERALRSVFGESERDERELFATMSAAVKLGHERERAHAERNKYWYIIASIFGTTLGIIGSSVNNRLKMAEFRDMMEQQMAKSASVLYTIAGGGTTKKSDIIDAMKTEFAYQEQLAQNLKLMQENINYLVNKQTSLIEHLNHNEHAIDVQIKELRRLIVAASQTSAASDEQISKALSVVHQDLDYDKNAPSAVKPLMPVDPNQTIKGLGVIMLAIVIGTLIGKLG